MAGKTKTILSRPKYNYNATQWFWYRMFEVMFHDARQVRPDGSPTDEALLARAWFAWSEQEPAEDAERAFASWPECCHWLDKNWDIETAAVLQIVDAGADFETPECVSRLKALAAAPDTDSSVFELPEWARVVPAVDQLSIFSISAMVH